MNQSNWKSLNFILILAGIFTLVSCSTVVWDLIHLWGLMKSILLPVGVSLGMYTVIMLLCFLRWRYILLCYLPIGLYQIKQDIGVIVMYWNNPQADSFFYLPAKIHAWADILLLACAIVGTAIIVKNWLKQD